MTIDEYKVKLDEYLGLNGVLKVEEAGSWYDSWYITYNSPSGKAMVVYRIIKSNLQRKFSHGFYHSGSSIVTIPDLDPDTAEGLRQARAHLKKLRQKETDGCAD